MAHREVVVGGNQDGLALGLLGLGHLLSRASGRPTQQLDDLEARLVEALDMEERLQRRRRILDDDPEPVTSKIWSPPLTS